MFSVLYSFHLSYLIINGEFDLSDITWLNVGRFLTFFSEGAAVHLLSSLPEGREEASDWATLLLLRLPGLSRGHIPQHKWYHNDKQNHQVTNHKFKDLKNI